MSRSKAFFLNGGAGRLICAIPALEKYLEESGDDDFIIVAEGGTDMFKGHPTLDDRTYDNWTKNLFNNMLKHRECIWPEPYQLYQYYNQECSITQAFDLIINNKGIRDLPKPVLNLSKDELVAGRKVINEVKEKLKVDKVAVLQPFGRGIELVDSTLIDRTGRSIEFKDLKSIIKSLQDNNYGVIIMSELHMDFKEDKLKSEVAMPEGMNLRQWAAVIKYADKFIGCDSVGQHLSYITETETVVILGSTYPENVTYPDCDYFTILDLGQANRKYSPIRIVMDEGIDRHNETLMSMDDPITEYVTGVITGKIKHED